MVWAVDQVDVVWRRQGARGDNVLGNKWQSVTGKLSMVGADFFWAGWWCECVLISY